MTISRRSSIPMAIITALLAASPATAMSISGTDAGADEYRAAERIAQGFEGDRDMAAALAHYCRAAAQGHVGARYRIGWMLLNGRGVAVDAREAAAWLREAAAAGHKPSLGALRLIPSAEPKPRTVCAPPRRQPSPALAALWARAPAGIRDLVSEIAPAHGLDPDLVLAVIAVESAFDPRAVSHASAQGLMQLMPGTAVRFKVADVFDPRQNIGGGARYLAELIARYNADLDKVLAAYNAGENAVERYGGIPPYTETRNYVARIRALYD
jgi:TPR repeat protein